LHEIRVKPSPLEYLIAYLADRRSAGAALLTIKLIELVKCKGADLTGPNDIGERRGNYVARTTLGQALARGDDKTDVVANTKTAQKHEKTRR
jgi:hypothetical protein